MRRGRVAVVGVRDCDWPRNSAGRRPLPRLSTESNKNAARHKQMFAICEGMCYTENETRNLGKRSVCHVLFGAIHGAKRDRELPGDGGGGLPPRAAAGCADEAGPYFSRLIRLEVSRRLPPAA